MHSKIKYINDLTIKRTAKYDSVTFNKPDK